MITLSIFLGRFFGLYLIISGFFYLTQGDFIRKAVSEFFKNGALLTISGVINVIVGLLVVLSHNVWMSNWMVIITIIGWLALIKGILRFFFPFSGKKFYEKLCSKNGTVYIGIIALIFGFFLTYKGFFFA